MKHIFSTLIATAFALGPLASGAQDNQSDPQDGQQLTQSPVSVAKGKAIKIRYKSKKFQGPLKSILIRDKATGKKVFLAVPLVNSKDGVYEVTYVPLFNSNDSGPSASTSNVMQIEVFPVKTNDESLAKSVNLADENVASIRTQQQEQQRMNYELAEAKKRSELEQQMQKLSEQEKRTRKEKAEIKAKEALSLYEANKYPEASEKFKEAITLDPESNKYYFKYGVSLFQQQEYQKSIVALSMADEGDFSSLERSYFMGMNHFRMNEGDKAIRYFTEVRDADDANLSPTAAFYSGVLQYNTSQYTEAKDSFNFVLDKSQDPKMDQSAENYLEKIDAIEQFNRNFQTKWLYNLYGGLMYDSNVLSIAAANAPTDLAGFRAMMGGSLERRLLYDYFKEWSAILSFSDMYSTNTSFAVDDELQKADPLTVGLSSPFRWKTTLFEKPYTVLINPGYETLLMNADGEGDREATTNSYYVKFENTFVHQPEWIGTYSLEYRHDQSLISGEAADDQTADKFTLGTSQVSIIDAKTSKSYITEASVALNKALGDNQTYQKLALGLTYTESWLWSSQVALRMDLTATTYPDHESSRQDTNYGFSASASKSLSEKWTTSLSIGWNQNSSNIDSSSYDKATVTNIYTYTGAF